MRATLLVLDDDQQTPGEWCVALQAVGQVIYRPSPDDALQYVSSSCPDVLIANLALHGRSGVDLISAVRGLPEPAGTLKAIAICDRANNMQHQQALMAGFDLYLTTPLSPDVIVDAVTRLIGGGRSA